MWTIRGKESAASDRPQCNTARYSSGTLGVLYLDDRRAVPQPQAEELQDCDCHDRVKAAATTIRGCNNNPRLQLRGCNNNPRLQQQSAAATTIRGCNNNPRLQQRSTAATMILLHQRCGTQKHRGHLAQVSQAAHSRFGKPAERALTNDEHTAAAIASPFLPWRR
jgi:hypothetical protein